MTGAMASPQQRGARRVPALVTDSLNFRRLTLFAIIGVLGGLTIPSLGPLREPVLVVAFLVLSTMLFSAVMRRRFTSAWGIAAFLCALEPAFRSFAPVLPYLALDYVLLLCGSLAFVLSPRRKIVQWVPAIAYGIYIALEIAGSVSADRWNAARGIVIPSLLMLVLVVNSTRLRLSPTSTTFVLACYVVGAITLAGFALRAYLSGDITWGTESNYEASGGMPPNHISVLMSLAVFACVVLSEDAKHLRRLALLGAATVLGSLMVLTFSRGGTVIVVGTLALYYIVFRKTSRKTIAVVFLMAGIGAVISYGAREITGGKIVDRYSKVNTSNRYDIDVQGWHIYMNHPILGVGTSNFREAITEQAFGRMTGAHNELIRAAAEHGTPGLLTWLMFIGSAFAAAAFTGDPHRVRRGLRVVILIFATTSMFYNGLKLTVQPMLILLALSAFTALDPAPKPAPPRKRTALM